ncbi:MAG TPA: VCBS repeat-containing protein, partial [Anaerolineae bacterium]|nr:VCBS repeat-containing protein [Anaerolineae bacterium]
MKLLRLTLIVVAALCAISLLAHFVSAAPAYTITQKWQRCYPGNWCETGWYAAPAVADLDKDGTPEVLWGGYTLMDVNGSNGTLKWNGSNTGRLWPGIVVADLDHNGSLEVVTANGDGYVSVYKSDGSSYSSAWPKQNFSGNEIRSLAVADLDGNQQMEIAIARASGGSYNQWTVLELDGSTRPGWPNLKPSEPGYGWGAYNENIGIGDIDGDHRAEIIGPSDVHYASAFNDDSTQIPANAIFGAGKFWSQVGLNVDQAADLRGYTNCGVENRPNMANSAPTIADVNGDGT